MSVMPRSACPVCQGTERRTLFVKDGYPVARCRACALVYVDAELDSDDLQPRYSANYYEGGVFHDYLGERDVRISSARRHCEVLGRLSPTGHLLDVGCAAGFFLEAAAERWRVVGVELSEFAADYARREFGHTVVTGDIATVDLPAGSFDVVTLWNTIEHMADPRKALACVARVLAPGGLVVLTTGNVSGPRARRNLREWDLMSPPEHLFFFQPRTIGRLLRDAGLEVRRVVQDGLIASSGPLTSEPVRRLASAAGLGDVMTVYARRPLSGCPPNTLVSKLSAYVRPVRKV